MSPAARSTALAAIGLVVLGTRAGAAPADPKADASAGAAGAVRVPDLDDVEHMCALLTGCDRLPLPAGLVPRDFVACTRSMYGELASPSAVAFSLTLRDCGLRASSCGELRACTLRGARSEVCAGRGKGAPVDHCDGDGRAITCVNERVATVRDCPRGGEQCVVRDGRAECALGGCEKEGPPTCSASGTRVLECKKGKLVSLDCAAFGLRCVSSAEGPRCATQGAACAEKAARCEGGVSVGCYHGREVRVDCAASGLACSGAGQPLGACTVPPPGGPGCDSQAAPRCDGAMVRWCAWGKPRSYLCKSMGLGRCVSDANGVRCAN